MELEAAEAFHFWQLLDQLLAVGFGIAAEYLLGAFAFGLRVQQVLGDFEQQLLAFCSCTELLRI